MSDCLWLPVPPWLKKPATQTRMPPEAGASDGNIARCISLVEMAVNETARKNGLLKPLCGWKKQPLTFPEKPHMAKNFHEQYERPELPLPPDRSTGLVFTAVALIVAYFWRADETVLKIALAIAAVLALVSFIAPILLRPLNIVWMRFALLLSKVMNPIVMLALFAVAIVPAGLIMQTRYDPLRRKRRPDAKSYWLERKKDEGASMTNQF